MSKTIGLTLIVKDEEDVLDRALESVKGCVDNTYITDTGSTDKTLDIAKKHGAIISHFDIEKVTVPVTDLPEEAQDIFNLEGIKEISYITNFAEARNFNFSQVKEEFILWMDADDVIQNADKIREIAEQDFDGVVFDYNYELDAQGRSIIKQPKIRLVRNDGSWRWESELHEHLISNRQVRMAENTEVVWDHHPKELKKSITPWRNLAIVLHKIKGLTEVDPRDQYSLANCYLGIEDFEKAEKAFDDFAKVSGWDEEVYQAHLRRSVCLRKLSRPQESVDTLLQAVKIQPLYPDAYKHLGESYFVLGEYEKAEHYLLQAIQMPKPDREQVQHPRDYDTNPLYLLGLCYANLGNLDGALKVFTKLRKDLPEREDLGQILAELNGLKKQEVDLKAITRVAEAIKELGTEHQLKTFFESVPGIYQYQPSVSRLRSAVAPKTETSGKEVIIYCGHPWEPWDSSSLETGIGGSEEAVIQISKRLAKEGWEVTVYGYPLNPGVQDGVNYANFWEWNPKDKTDIFISWRNVNLFDLDINATKRFLWLHDTPNKHEFLEKRVDKIDKIFVLSKFHRSYLPDIAEDKFFYTANGIDAKDFDLKIERNPKKMIYTSAPDRGLELLLDLWPEIKKRVPDAQLATYYGWQSWDKGNSGDLQKMAWKDKILKKLKELDQSYDRIGHQDIAKEMLSSGVWGYPTEFPEISCITAMKAQLAGAIPVTVTYSALNETVQHGVKLDYSDIYTNKKAQQEFIDAVVEQMTNPMDRKEMQAWALKTFSWDEVSQQWSGLFSGSQDSGLTPSTATTTGGQKNPSTSKG